jgi:hypothetical protein
MFFIWLRRARQAKAFFGSIDDVIVKIAVNKRNE